MVKASQAGSKLIKGGIKGSPSWVGSGERW
jgi:hypothetical protein